MAEKTSEMMTLDDARKALIRLEKGAKLKATALRAYIRVLESQEDPSGQEEEMDASN